MVNEYFRQNGIDPSKLVDFELVNAYLKACQKSTPRGIRITKARGRLNLRFATETKSGNSDNGCNESLSRDGCVSALAKTLAIADKLKDGGSETEFWQWYDVSIKGKQSLENDVVTIGEAAEIVKQGFMSGVDKVGRRRDAPELATNSLANYHDAYGTFYSRLNPELPLTADNIISEVMRNWGLLHQKKTKGFKDAYSACCKLLRDTKRTAELDKVQSHFGVIRVLSKSKEQTIDLEAFLDFRARVLGLNGYTLTKAQERGLGSRRSWFKALCINVLYGFRSSEGQAVLNLDKSIVIDGYTFKALHDPSNTENILVLGDGFWVTDSAGKKHWITIKTGERIARPMSHPDYPRLIELLGIKDSAVSLPVVTPKSNSALTTIKRCYSDAMRRLLNRYIKQVGGKGFTQTHALRHLANYHGKLAGLTRDQRALSLGHSAAMNDNYDKHQTMRNQVNLLMADITEKSEVQRLREELDQARSANKSLEETIEFLKRENAHLREQLNGDNIVPLTKLG